MIGMSTFIVSLLSSFIDDVALTEFQDAGAIQILEKIWGEILKYSFEKRS